MAMVLSSCLISAGRPASTGTAGGGGGGTSGGGFDDIGKSPMFEVTDQNRFVILQNPICFVKQTALDGSCRLEISPATVLPFCSFFHFRERENLAIWQSTPIT